jgi:hypothetical protein
VSDSILPDSDVEGAALACNRAMLFPFLLHLKKEKEELPKGCFSVTSTTRRSM